MSNLIVTFILCYSILISTIIVKASKVEKEQWIKNVTRHKRDDDWIWGADESSEQNDKNDTDENKMTAEDEEGAKACAPYPPDVPNFSSPGRRISETKCYEYIWHMNYREEKAKRDKACVAYNRKKSGITIHTLVIGGHGALPGEYPHMGAIGWKASVGTWVFKCGGSLISSKFVLTAGHCTKVSSRDTTITDPEPKIVRLGDKNILDVSNAGFEPTDATINRIIVHPYYSSPKKYNDIALLELDNDVEFTKFIQPACLWKSYDTRAFSKATITGWGVVETGGLETPPNLQAAEVDIIDSRTCDRLLRPWCNRLWCGVQNSQICAGNLSGGVDSCQGDSGGPLQVKIALPPSSEGSIYFVVGVTSFGVGCARANTPGVYTRVSSFIDWIEEIVWM